MDTGVLSQNQWTCSFICLRAGPAVRRRDVLRRQPLDPQPQDVHPDGKPGRRVPPPEPQSPLLWAADAPQLPVPPGAGLPEDSSQQIQVFTRLQKRRCVFLAGTVLY